MAQNNDESSYNLLNTKTVQQLYPLVDKAIKNQRNFSLRLEIHRQYLLYQNEILQSTTQYIENLLIPLRNNGFSINNGHVNYDEYIPIYLIKNDMYNHRRVDSQLCKKLGWGIYSFRIPILNKLSDVYTVGYHPHSDSLGKWCISVETKGTLFTVERCVSIRDSMRCIDLLSSYPLSLDRQKQLQIIMSSPQHT